MAHAVSFHPDNGVQGDLTLSAVHRPSGEESKGERIAQLTSYLAQLGLRDEHLGKVMSLLEAMEGEELPDDTSGERQTLEASPPPAPEPPAPAKTVKLYVAEEQAILRQAYHSFFGIEPSIVMVGSSDDTRDASLMEAARKLNPDVLLLGVKKVQGPTVQKLEALRAAYPDLGLCLLFANFDAPGVRALREFSRGSSGGRAYLLKHTIDTVEQLTQVVHSVAQGRVIIDPMVMEEMIRPEETHRRLLRELSPRALEVLSCLAKGYRNETIADALSRDVKTIERHINNIYTTLQAGQDDSCHPRVRAALVYLRATGSLSADQHLLNDW